LEDAIARYRAPEIVNTDQGSQFSSMAFTGLLKEHGIRILPPRRRARGAELKQPAF
jgi:transposase InsO family protein